MGILDTLLGSAGGGAVQQIGRQLGMDDAATRAVVGKLLPALGGGLQRNLAAGNGLEQLQAALSNGNHARYVEDASALQHPATIDDGNKILGHLFGSKDVSRNVAANAASETGVDASLVKKLLPIVAAAAMGALSKETAGGAKLSQGGGLDLLSGLLGSGGGDTLGNLLSIGRKLL